MINEDNLNLEIRKFLKRVGITSQRVLEGNIFKAFDSNKLKIGSDIEIEMKMTIKSLEVEHIISEKIKIE